MPLRRFAGLALCVVAASCGGGDSTSTTPAPLVVTALDGGGQTATVGKAVAVSPSVKVTQGGAAAANVSVTFAVASGGGSVVAATVATGSDGVARVGGWTLGTVAETNTLTATVSGASGSPVTISATATAGPASVVTKVAGDAISSAAGVAVTAKPTVKVSDSFGNGVSGVTVVFTLGSAVGTVTGASAVTGADGTAAVGGWTINSVPAPNTLLATAGGSGLIGNPVTFTITGVAGPVASIAKVAGDNQSAGVSTAVLLPPSVKIADQFGNLISGQTVTFAVASGGGTVSGATPVSSSGGVATAGGWTLGANPGTNTLTATAASFTATFTATGTAGLVFNPLQYSGGAYTGSWTNTTFASTGVGSAQIVVSGSTATVTVSVSGSVLGNAGGVPNTVKAGTFTSTGAAFTGNVPPMGDITGTIDAAGNIVASGVNVPGTGGIARWDATGTLTTGALSMTFKVTFTSGSTAVGTIDLRRP